MHFLKCIKRYDIKIYILHQELIFNLATRKLASQNKPLSKACFLWNINLCRH